jgi:hypothetical protein
VSRSYAQRLGELEELRRKVEPQLRGMALLESDWEIHLAHVNAARLHASDTLADPSRAPIDPRFGTRNEGVR